MSVKVQRALVDECAQKTLYGIVTGKTGQCAHVRASAGTKKGCQGPCVAPKQELLTVHEQGGLVLEVMVGET